MTNSTIMENNSKTIEDILPDCWKDDVRMNSLFAPFRKRSANPQDWDSKFTFWKCLIEKWCFLNMKPVITVTEVSAAFERSGKRALCLHEVVLEVLRTGEWCRLCELEKEVPESWSDWALQMMVKRPLQWAAGQLLTNSQISCDEPVVLLSVLKNASDNIMLRWQSILVDEEELLLGEENARLALLYLRRHRLVTFTVCGQRKVVKLGQAKTIGEVERASFMLVENEKKLRVNMERMEEEKQRLQLEAREYLKKGMRHLAKSSLKKRHVLDKNIQKRMEALSNIQNLLQRVEEAETDAQVLESYRAGVIALKKTLSEGGLTLESVENTKADLEEVLELHEDITCSLSGEGNISASEELELEEELSKILGDPNVRKSSSDGEGLKEVLNRLELINLEDLPNPPMHPPSQPLSIKSERREEVLF